MKLAWPWSLPACGILGIKVRQSLRHVALMVRDYNEAIDYFVGRLGFQLLCDAYQPEQNKRWVLIAPPGSDPNGISILLARASDDEQANAIGHQSGGRVFLFLETDDFDRDFAAMTAKGIHFVREPATQAYGKVAVFEDLYGNLWDLIQYS
jgi:catechol 2,3-dioxygenase-like lactoylglutathione lyase family enzyme